MEDQYEIKYTVLKLIKGLGNASVEDVVNQSDGNLNPESARMVLLRLFRQGLLHRSKNGHAYFYTITDRGIDRILFHETKDQ